MSISRLSGVTCPLPSLYAPFIIMQSKHSQLSINNEHLYVSLINKNLFVCQYSCI